MPDTILPHPHANKPPEHNRLALDYRAPIPRPKVIGPAVDFHVHIAAARHAQLFLNVAAHYGFQHVLSMTPLEEALVIQRDYPRRIQFIAIPRWHDWGQGFIDSWLRRIEAFYNIGSRIVKFWFAPPAIGDRGWRLDSPQFRPLLREAVSRGMAVMTHVGDPDAWYHTRYADARQFGSREDHYRMWQNALDEYPGVTWLAAHLAGNPENLPRLQQLLDRYPNLYMDCSATKWIVRELSVRRDSAREFFIRNQDRLIFGTDLVTADQRGWDFLASRFWTLRRMWETARVEPSPIDDPDLPDDSQPTLRGLALPDACLQKLYRDNALRFLNSAGAAAFPSC